MNAELRHEMQTLIIIWSRWEEEELNKLTDKQLVKLYEKYLMVDTW